MSEYNKDNEFDKELEERRYVCPVCGKPFTLPFFTSRTEYVYTISIYDKRIKKAVKRKCCSYSCWIKGSK